MACFGGKKRGKRIGRRGKVAFGNDDIANEWKERSKREKKGKVERGKDKKREGTRGKR